MKMNTQVIGVPVPHDPSHRYDFVTIFHASHSSPNTDPDTNEPRIDPTTGEGVTSGPNLRRKIRNSAMRLIGELDGWDMLMKSKSIVSVALEEVYRKVEAEKKNGKGSKTKNGDAVLVEDAARAVCARYFDIRWFGGVLTSPSANCGQIHGPLSVAGARSFEPIEILKMTTTPTMVRSEAQSEDTKGFNQTMAPNSVAVVRFGVYYSTGAFDPPFAKKTGLSDDDLILFWNALAAMYWWDKASARPDMAVQRLIVFEHDNALGRAPSHKLLDTILGKDADGLPLVRRRNPKLPASRYDDYMVPSHDEIVAAVKKLKINGVTVHDLV